MRRIRGRKERGAVAAMVAIVMAGGVALAALAVSVDVGNIMLERSRLQNGADATAMALAQDCAVESTDCAAANLPKLELLAGANAGDGASRLTADPDPGKSDICVSTAALSTKLQVPLCSDPGSYTSLRDCPPVPGWLVPEIPYVETNAQTKGADGKTILPSVFARALAGEAKGEGYGACARAAWGPGNPSQLNTLAIAMSECDWQKQTGYTATTTAVYPPGPGPKTAAHPYGYGSVEHPWPTSFEKSVYAQGNPTSCDTSSSGGTAPGGFAWLEGVTKVECMSAISKNHWIKGDTGNDGCSADDLAKYLGDIVYVPVFDCKNDSTWPHPIPQTTPPFKCDGATGNNLRYHISGYAAFYLTGWVLTQNGNTQPKIKPSIATGRTTCVGASATGPDPRCLTGWFLKDLLTEGEIVIPPPGGTPNYGIIIAKPAG